MKPDPCQILPLQWASRRRAASCHSVLAALAAAALLAGCGDKTGKAASQTAVRVNSEEITVHQINAVLQQRPGVQPDKVDQVSAAILEKLIDQEVVVQKAVDQKLDRSAQVVQQLDAARRDILSRAYLESIASLASKPTPQEVRDYYDGHPELFKDRRVFQLQQLLIDAGPEQADMLRGKLAAARGLSEFTEQLRISKLRYSEGLLVRAAEQLAVDHLKAVSAMKPGQNAIVVGSNGIQVLSLLGSRAEPMSEDEARAAIEQYLLNERRRKVAADEVRRLRTAATVEYVGKFVPKDSESVPPRSTQGAAAPASQSAAGS